MSIKQSLYLPASLMNCYQKWMCFYRATSYREAVLMAANLGDDADTTAAVCGQLAGAFWGEGGIPAEWLAKLVMAGEIRALADALVPR